MKIMIRVACALLATLTFQSCLGSFFSSESPFIPSNYESSVSTGGDIEAKYLSKGPYDVSMIAHKTEDDIKEIVVYYPATINEMQSPLPAVVFVNGTGVVASKYSPLFKHLASWGFIVVGNEEKESWDGEASEKSLSYLLDLNQDRESVFYGKVDCSNIGASGHSQGGAGVLNTVTAQEHSSLYKTAVALSPTHEELSIALEWNYDLKKISIPIMIMAGTEGKFETELVIPLEKMEAMYNSIKSPKVMARRIGAEHGHMLYSADGYVTAWFMWQLRGDAYAARAFIGDDSELLSNKLYINQKINLAR